MPAKPKKQTILESYTLNELIELAKERAAEDAREQLNSAREHLKALSAAMGGAVKATPPESTPSKGRRGRPKGVKKQASPPAEPKTPKTKLGRKKAKASAKTSGKMSLGAHLNELLGSKPMDVETIMKTLDERGYVSKSKDPRRVLYLELKKQIDKGNAIKSERGMYAKA